MIFFPVERANCMHGTEGLVNIKTPSRHLRGKKKIRFARNLILNMSELNSNVCKHQVISVNHMGTPLYMSHNIRGNGWTSVHHAHRAVHWDYLACRVTPLGACLGASVLKLDDTGHT
jgi:hypothetical protein